jgi:hypothetical protein
MKGFLTNQRYRYVTVFVDHFSSLSYIHIQKSTGGEETLQAKKEFETYCATHGIKIKHYHADNGRFAENLFTADVAAHGQTISFCGVNAHW